MGVEPILRDVRPPGASISPEIRHPCCLQQAPPNIGRSHHFQMNLVRTKAIDKHVRNTRRLDHHGGRRLFIHRKLSVTGVETSGCSFSYSTWIFADGKESLRTIQQYELFLMTYS